MPDLLTTGEVARNLKTTTTHVRRLIAAGLLKASRVGTLRWRIKPEDLEHFLSARSNETQRGGEA